MTRIRTTFVGALAFGVLASTAVWSSPNPTVSHASDKPALTAPQAENRLKDGNDRYVHHKSIHPDQTREHMTSLTSGQHPFAVILSCADSRVPPELVFDQGLGDLFVVRVAGNTVNDETLGSIEYAVEHLGSPLIVVMGHEKCGAVQAAMSGKEEPGHILSIAKPIEVVLQDAKKMPGDPVHNAVLANARHVADELRHSEPILAHAVSVGKLVVVSAVYDLATGRVSFDQ